MVAYVLKRLVFAIIAFFAVTLVAFILFHLIPTAAPPSTESIFVRYGRFARELVLHGSLDAAYNRRDINQLVADAAPITASVVFGGALLWLAIALPLGVLSALRPRSLLDRGILTFVLLAISVPPIWLGVMVSYFVGFKLGWAPIAGYCEAFSPPRDALCGGVTQWFSHLVLPWLTFAVLFAALYTRMTRASVLEELSKEYVRTARAKGAPERTVIRHVLRNVLLGLVTMLAMDVPVALGGAIYIEVVFGLPGLGLEAWQSIAREDYPVLQGVVIFTSVCVIVASLLVDVLYAALDPRVRVAGARAVG